ncbi:LPS assembly lipoprotein LptE [Odoribacter sp. OttesenSCG-928-L07]|nr:LPS assembly lipoprotein LptE [Odoribacter sp. OttesenSCG-928-L07]MDL2239325.1 LPS assembly lipoprotein LptE [Bacteroidales bacterium OttesenSCG-928-L14]MDL2240370.1 LPS assembly lipoprotein LptE [Bacteroidales bacterium OttesenSCG-928-K22]
MASNKKIYIFIAIISLIFSLSACGIYSFTGASIDPNVKTVSIDYFQNQATLVNPSLSQTITEALKDRFLNRTSLRLVDEEGDLQFSGAITSYHTSPQAITGDQTAALNRLTITVRVTFVNLIDEKSNFNTSFSRYVDYDSSLNLSEVEDSLVEEIVKDLIDDIFNRSVVNW